VVEGPRLGVNNKYAEGYPRKAGMAVRKRDVVEQLAIDRAKNYSAPTCNFSHWQPGQHAVYFAFLTRRKMRPWTSARRHLTTGNMAISSGKFFEIVIMGSKEDERIDYDQLAKWPRNPAK